MWNNWLLLSEAPLEDRSRDGRNRGARTLQNKLVLRVVFAAIMCCPFSRVDVKRWVDQPLRSSCWASSGSDFGIGLFLSTS